MALIHFAQDWEFEVILPDRRKYNFHNLLEAITYCNYNHLQYELKTTI